MPPKNNDRLRSIRENAAHLRRRSSDEEGSSASTPSDNAALSAHFGIAALEHVTAGRAIQRIPIHRIAPALDPQTRQPRLLPLPEDVMVNGEPMLAYGDGAIISDLLDLGQSLKERQIQPILVYSGQSDHYPEAEYLILVGHRRWLAAHLSSLAELDAIVIEPPSPIERVQLQYAENEDRADFTDMERAWALQQMKEVLHDAPWEAVEQRFRLSTTRRHELTRLLAFTTTQQQSIARLRLRENQIEPLHRAVRAGELSPPHVDAILEQIQHKTQTAASETSQGIHVDSGTVTRLVVQAKRAAGTTTAKSPQWLPPFHTRMVALIKDLKRFEPRFGDLSGEEQDQLVKDLESLLTSTHTALNTLQQTDTDTT